MRLRKQFQTGSHKNEERTFNSFKEPMPSNEVEQMKAHGEMKNHTVSKMSVSRENA
jgi:hypothetical protein